MWQYVSGGAIIRDTDGIMHVPVECGNSTPGGYIVRRCWFFASIIFVFSRQYAIWALNSTTGEQLGFHLFPNVSSWDSYIRYPSFQVDILLIDLNIMGSIFPCCGYFRAVASAR